MNYPEKAFERNYVVLPFKSKKIENKYLITNDLGKWIFLDKTQLELLKSKKVHYDRELFASLNFLGLIMVQNNFKNVKNILKRKMWFLNNGTSLHVIALTNKCNFACKYCYAPSKDLLDLNQETARKIIDFATSSPSKTNIIEFSGGEPLLNFDAIKWLVTYSEEFSKKRNKEFKFSIIQNGSNWDEEKLKFFIEKRIGVCFSLDGPKDLHNRHRPYLGGGGTYDEVVKWIKRFRKEGYRGIYALPVITKHSLSRGREIVDEYLSLGFRKIRFKYLAYFGRASEIWDELSYTAEEFLESWKDVIEYMFELNKRGIFVIEGLTQILSRKIFLETDPGYCELQMPCGAGIGQLAYSPDGGVYTCDEGRMFEEFKIGSVNQKYSEVMKNNIIKEMTTASSGFFNSCENCVFKPFCGICPLESYKAQGSIYSKIPQDRRCKIHKGMLTYLFSKMQKEPEFKKMLLIWANELNFNTMRRNRRS